MALKIPTSDSIEISSPEELFQSFKGRNPAVKNLWSQQADMLRAYDSIQKDRDIALELPTGSGKTLIALLIAEFRRQKFKERTIYLCPTRQLAKQVSRQASDYGIETVTLVGPQADYDPRAYAKFVTTECVAISTYSAIFNTNPRINNPQAIIIDDAHAAENYITKLWSVSIGRKSHSELYVALLGLLKQAIPESLFHALQSQDAANHERSAIGKIMQSDYWRLLPEIRDLLAVNVSRENELEFPWSMIYEHLDACNIFVSWDEICIRPFFPPTQTHAPFWSANQRIYLSATLGESGDLERALGIEKISRLPAPKGWDRNSQGRRLILVPNLSFGQVDTERLCANIIQNTQRALVLCPNKYGLSKFEKALQENGVTKSCLHSMHIENDISAFTESSSVLLLANRFDGIDLPDDSCRIECIAELPDATNIQEKFLSDKLGAASVLRERIRTRITQALGRCTRNDTDFAVLILIGESLSATIADSDFRANFHPDTQLEFEVGIENSKDCTFESMLENVELFLHEQEFRSQIDDYVIKNRSKRIKKCDPNAEALLNSAPYEIAYMYAIWKGEDEKAYECARLACDKLSGGSTIRSYRALWYYFAASMAKKISDCESGIDLIGAYNDLITRARQCSDNISWFSILKQDQIQSGSISEIDVIAIENSAKELIRLGTIGRRFEANITELSKKLAATKATHYEDGLLSLGKLLGFNVLHPTEEAAPDSIWDIDRKLVITFEAKSDEGKDKKIPAKDIRQAKSHKDWVKSKYQLPEDTIIIPVLVTYQNSVEDNAKPLIDALYYINCQELAEIASALFIALRSSRSKAVPTNETELRAVIATEFKKNGLLPQSIVARFRKIHDALNVSD